MFRKMLVLVCLTGALVPLLACETVCYTVYPITGCNSDHSGFLGADDDGGNQSTAITGLPLINGQSVSNGGQVSIGLGGSLHFDLSGMTGGPFLIKINGVLVCPTPAFICDWTPPAGGGTFTVEIIGADGQVVTWIIIVQVAISPPPPPPPNIEPTVTFTDVQPAGGTYEHGGNLSFEVKVSVSNGDGRQLNLRCLPYVGNAFNTAFAATNGSHTINVVVALTDVTNLGNNYFNVYDGGTAISQWWTVSITVN